MIKHEWNGTILTITSDSGTSSADLQGVKGDTGARGVRGLPGENNVDLSPYYTAEETRQYLEQEINNIMDAMEEALEGVESGSVDLSNYYTKAETDAAIEAHTPDLSAYYTELETKAFVINQVSKCATKADIADFITIDDVEAKGYQTAAEVETAINSAIGGVENGTY